MSYLDIAQNCSVKCEEWEKILDHYNESVSDDEVWEIARQFEDLPIFGNIYQRLVLNRVLFHFCEETGQDEADLDLFYFINSSDTHLAINGTDICTIDDYWHCVKRNRVIH